MESKIKIILIFRKKRHNCTSIEIVFDNIHNSLNKDFQLVRYELTGNIFKDIKNLLEMKGDVYHITGDVNYIAILLFWKNIILTVHDFGHINSLKYIKKLIYKFIWFDLPIRIANKITFVSEKTLKDCVAYYGTRKKYNVINNAFSNALISTDNKIEDSGRCTILQVGTKSYKNHKKVIDILSLVKDKDSFRLIIIGTLDDDDKDKLKRHSINFKNFVDLDFEDVVEIYKKSDIVTVLSSGEGFGMPVIEANASANALIISNIEPLISIANGSALIADTNKVLYISKQIEELINNHDLRNEFKAKGIANAENYRPEFIAGKYKKVYLELYEENFIRK